MRGQWVNLITVKFRDLINNLAYPLTRIGVEYRYFAGKTVKRLGGSYDEI